VSVDNVCGLGATNEKKGEREKMVTKKCGDVEEKKLRWNSKKKMAGLCFLDHIA